MQYNPRPHQELAASFLAEHDRAALFLDMGLGKTVIALTHFSELWQYGLVDRCLVIAPKRVAEDTWSREADKWDHLHHLRISKILGSAKQRNEALNATADVYVINRENVQWLVEKLGKNWPFDMVVIDELSSFKSSKSKRWRCLRRVIGLSQYVIGLTGTPAPNGYEDLWAEVFLIDGGEHLGKTLGQYRATYFVPGAHNGRIVYEWKLRPRSKQIIDQTLSEFCLSMSKEDWLQMPPLIYNDVPVRMDAHAKEVCDWLVVNRIIALEDGKVSDDIEGATSAVVASSAAVLANKLLQMANGSVYDDQGSVFHIHDEKLDALESIVEEAAGSPVLVFYNYKHDLVRLKKRFPQGRELKDNHDISSWNNGEIPILFVHPASAGHGLNLQEGGHIIAWFGLPWSLELYQQANARLYRQGQEQSVIIHHIITEGTYDEKVLQVLSSKDATQKSLLDSLKAGLAEAMKGINDGV